MTINQNICKLRLQKHLSQEGLGELLGVSGQAVSKWEQGITSPDISLLPALADCFGVTIDSLFSGMPVRKYPGYGSERAELLAIYDGSGKEEDFRRAAEAYGELILNGKASTEDYVSYGILHRMRAAKDTGIALHYYRRAIAEGNDHRDLQWMTAHQLITHLLEDQGRLDEAIVEHKAWRDTEPECAWARVSYSHALERAGRLDEAWAELETALQLDPEDVNVRTAAGDLLGQLGRCDEAIIHWDKAYELDPACISCKFSKAEMFAANGENDRAIAQFEEILHWLEEHGYNMELEAAYPLSRIEQLRGR